MIEFRIAGAGSLIHPLQAGTTFTIAPNGSNTFSTSTLGLPLHIAPGVALILQREDFTMINFRSAIAFCLLAHSLACEMPDLPDVADTEQAIIAGDIPTTASYHDVNGIGMWGGNGVAPGCTASLIDDDWILLAGHCGGYLDTIDNSSSNHQQFRGSLNTPTTWAGSGPVGGCPFTADPTRPCSETQRTLALGTYSQLASAAWPGEDVMVARLSTAFPSTFTVLPLSMSEATSGLVTYWGTSNSNAACTTGAGQTRSRKLMLPDAPDILCPGDSGGPRTVGSSMPRGPIDAVNSAGGGGGSMRPAVVVPYRNEILNTIAAWNSGGGNDISVWAGGAFCTHPTSRLFYGDVDGNGEVDAICHDFSTGVRWIAASHNRLILPAWASTVPFCAGTTGSDAYVGDFNGDGRTDIMCHPKTTGDMSIDYADATGSFHTSGWWSSPSIFWCTQSQQHLLTGDVNGDGRTDLICHDRTTGVIGWMLADASGHFDGTTAGATGPGFCTRPTDWLYVGEFTGMDADGTSQHPRSDLICVTQSTGEMFVQFSHSASIPYNGTTDFILAAGRPTGATCSTSSQCNTTHGESCDSGRCVEHLCTGPNADLTIADVTGDKLTDVLCTYYDATDGDGNRRNDKVIWSSGIRAFGGVREHAGIFTNMLSWSVGSASYFPFSTGQGIRIRKVSPATQSITAPPSGIRAVTTR